MTTNHRSTKPTTRNEFNSRLQSLSTRNEELEESLRESEESCQEYEAKNNAQHALIHNLMETIHSLTTSNSHKDAKIPEKMCLLLTKNAQRVSDLSEEVERMKLRLKNQMERSRSVKVNYYEDADESKQGEDEVEVEFVDVSLCDNDNEYTPSVSISSSFSSPQTPASGQETIRLEEEIVRISSKCESLERSLSTLKRKSALREVRSMKSLRNMRQQVERLEQERKRRLELQTNAEDRALELEIELLKLKQEDSRQDIFRRRQHQHPQDQVESAENSNVREAKRIESDPLTKKGIDHCRERIILRNQLDKDSFPQLLLVVSEESEESQESEDDFRPCIDGAVTSE